MVGQRAIGFVTSWRTQGTQQFRRVCGNSPKLVRPLGTSPRSLAPDTSASTLASTSRSPRASTPTSKRCWILVGQVGPFSMLSTTTRAPCRILAVISISARWWAATSMVVSIHRLPLPTLSPCASGSLALFSEPGWPRALQEASQLLLRKGTGALETCFHTLLLSGGVSLKAVGFQLSFFSFSSHRYLDIHILRWRSWHRLRSGGYRRGLLCHRTSGRSLSRWA